MCGIAALFSYRSDASKVSREELRAIRDFMARRGPDGSGEWFSADDRVALGHRRLSILDLSEKGAQPMASQDGSLVISFNGEIYNYRELRKDLEAKGHHFKSDSDTEVLLYLYREKGESMFDELRGMFAFALWDQQKKSMLLARDPFGIKPLYYTGKKGIFKAASQVKALLKGDDIDTALDPAGHAGFFLWGFVPEPHTLYKNIRSFPAGCFMVIDENGPRAPQRYFSFREEYLSVKNTAPAAADERERKRVLRDALLDSVRHHLIADVPVGVFLSSGIDSTVVTALASEFKPNINAITVVFDEYKGTENDESELAAVVARQYGVSHRKILVTKEMFRKRVDEFFQAMDQPTIDGLNTFFISQAAKEAGLKVALSGLGGDEIFGGYPGFRDIPRAVRYFSWAQGFPVFGKIFRKGATPFLKARGSPKWAGVLEYGGTFEGAYLLRRALFMPWELDQFLDRDLIHEGLRDLATEGSLRQTVGDVPDDRLRVSFLEMEWYMRSQLLRDADWAGMYHSLEIRTPFLDRNFFDTLLPLLMQKTSLSKNDLAKTPAKALPARVVRRKKTGFTTPVDRWIQEMMGSKIVKQERGSRNWAKVVYDRF